MAAHAVRSWQYYAGVSDKNLKTHSRTILAVAVVFSSSLLLALFILYLRWACSRRRAGALPQRAPAGLDAETIGGLPVLLHRPAPPGDDSQCAICLGGLAEGEKVKVLPSCGHAFHPECVDAWLRAHASCPLCRAFLGASPAPASAV